MVGIEDLKCGKGATIHLFYSDSYMSPGRPGKEGTRNELDQGDELYKGRRGTRRTMGPGDKGIRGPGGPGDQGTMGGGQDYNGDEGDNQ